MTQCKGGAEGEAESCHGYEKGYHGYEKGCYGYEKGCHDHVKGCYGHAMGGSTNLSGSNHLDDRGKGVKGHSSVTKIIGV